MKFKIQLFQGCTIILLLFFFFFSSSWIVVHIQDPENSFKAAMELTISFLGPISTIFAAIIATFLFNDWKDQHKANFYVNECKEIINEYKKFITIAQNLKSLESKLATLILNDSQKARQPILLQPKEIEAIYKINKEASEHRDLLNLSFEKMNNAVHVLNILNENEDLRDGREEFFKSITKNYLPLFDFKPIEKQPYEMFNTLKKVNPRLMTVIQSSEKFISEIKKIGNI